MKEVKIEVYVERSWYELLTETALGITSCKTVKQAVDKMLSWGWGVRLTEI